MVEPSTFTAAGAAGASAKWLWDKFGADVFSKATAVAKEKWRELKWSELEARYRTRLLAEHSTTKLLGNPKEIDLDTIYTDVYVFDEVSAFRRLDVEDLRKEQFDRAGITNLMMRYPLLQIAEKQKRLYVLGKPGAGKSTFLKKIVRLCCTGQLQMTPIFVPLKRWSDSEKCLEDFMVSEFAICGFPDARAFVDALLASNGAVVLFDGLDEVPNTAESRREAITALSEFSRKYPELKILLTCRTAATEYSFDKFAYVEIADFVPSQQREFIAKWYSDRPDTRERLLRQWDQEDSAGLKDLAKTPLLLALLCLAYDSTLSFPRRRVELYEEAVNALLRKWDASREIARDEIYKGLSHGRKEQMLRRIAFECFVKADIFIAKPQLVKIVEAFLGELPPDDVSKGIDGEVVIRSMEAQHGLIIERAYDIYSFSHLTVHEYFVAKRVVESTKTEEVISLARRHATDDQWREVFLMVASMLDDGRFLVDALIGVLKELPANNPRIGRLLGDLLTARHASRSHKYGATRTSAADDPLNGDQQYILECCVTIAGNMSTLGLPDRHVAVPRMIAAGLRTDPNALSRNFSADVDQLRQVRAYFRLAALISDCLTLTTLPAREIYLQQLLVSPNSVLPS